MIKECNFKPISAEFNRDGCIWDVFLNGLLSSQIQLRLSNLPVKEVYKQAQCLKIAQQNATLFQCYNSNSNKISEGSKINETNEPPRPPTIATAALKCI